MISRTMYCEYCSRNNRPQPKDLYVTFGTESQKFIVDKAFFDKEHRDYKELMRGFTPHIIMKTKTVGNYVYFEESCGMHDCDVKITKDGDNYRFTVTDSREGKMHVKQWNAMILNPNIGYSI
jgi:hypothetical protein